MILTDDGEKRSPRAEETYDQAILDYQMDGMDGAPLFRLLRLYPGLPAIIIGPAPSPVRSKPRKGAYDYLTPI
jgi:CheY-like chemotaxis protein